MEYNGVNTTVCAAEESDWLDISYSERKFVRTPDKPQAQQAKFKPKFTKPLKIAAIALLCVALLAALLFIDGNFGKDVFQTAKAAFSSTLFAPKPQQTVAAIAIPCNINLVDVADGVATFNGGRAVLSFTDGKVIAASESSVTVAVDDNTQLTYDGFTSVLVNVGDSVTCNSLLGKYDQTFTATVSVDGQPVKDVVGSSTQLTWNV